MDTYSQLAEAIIEQQSAIIGPVAIQQAEQITDLEIDWSHHHVTIHGEPRQAIDKLVGRYERLFGGISVQVSREAAAKIIPHIPVENLPKSLQ
jgi:hypothetical protein